jgi:hypothetical protein
MSFKALKVVCIGLSLTIGTFANGSLINVSTIKVSNNPSLSLQVAEVVAWGTLSNADLALASMGATAFATDFWKGDESCGTDTQSADCVLDGGGAESLLSLYHGFKQTDSILTISLATSSELDWFGIYGRLDCCSDGRQLYTVSFYNDSGTLLYSTTADANNSDNFARIELASFTARTEVPEPPILSLLIIALIVVASCRFKNNR